MHTIHTILIILCILYSTGFCAIKKGYYGLYDDELDEIPEGASTLAFVFDITGSMYDDLVQVIRGAARILNTLLERREKPIYNYVLIPFHDPDIGPVTVTTDPDIFHQQLKDLYVQGGGDCPEMSVGAVKLALEVSLPNSYIYVFTDARSKDYNLLEDVLKLMQKKESQVIFVMTGDCGDQTHPGFQAYERIALSSSGQVFHLKKSDVDEVLNFVQVSLQARKVNLLAVDRDEGNHTEFNFEVDTNLREFTLSIAGDNPKVIIINPKGEIVNDYNGLNELLNLNNVQIVNIKDPIPGQWLLKFDSDSRHSIRATGLSRLDFQHGYSREPTANMEETYHRPLKGAPTYLLINATELLEPGLFTKVQLIDLKGNILREASLEKFPGTSTLFTAMFIPPDEYFYLKVLGRDEKNYPFQRMTAVPISSQLPGIPEVTTRPHLYGYYGKESIIRCYVESLVPFSATWHKDNIQISQEHQFPQTTELTLIIPEVTSLSEGYYTCNATNIAGSSSSATFLDVKEPPPIISKPENMSVVPDKTAELSCIVSSTVPYNVTWFRLTMDKAGYFRQKSIKDNLRAKVHENQSLIIHQVTNDDEGWYRCIATNEGGFNKQQFYLAVQEPPIVTIYPSSPKFTSDDSVNITCVVTGYPPPIVQWTWDKKHDKAMQEGRMHIEKNSLIIYRTHPDDEGHYECKAENAAGTDMKSIFFQYIEAPVITLPEKHILIRHGDIATLRCIAEGIPLPRVSWFHGNIEIFPTSYIHQDSSGSLIINGVQETDAGNYSCLAINEAGAAEESLYLDVGSAPVIVHGPADTSIDIGTSGSISCSATGLPYPSITWQRKNGENLEENPRFIVTSSGNLYIHEVTKDDEGSYVCIVENRFGRHMLEAFVTVSGIVPPALKDADSSAAVKKGETIFLPCEIKQGNPHPIIYWLWNGRIIRNEVDMEIFANGTLKIKNANDHHQAVFVCVASNVGGNATNSIELDIQEPPIFIGELKEDYVAVEGQDISLSCSVIGSPKPEITWFKNNVPIFIDNIQFKLLPSNDLYISEINENDIGIYTCEAVNVVGVTNQTINLIVHVPPKFKSSQNMFTAIEGDQITLPCETHAVPKADIYWYHNNLYLPSDVQILSNGNIHFKADLNHAGDYLCQAKNIVGTSDKLFTVKVWIPPSINSIDPENITIIEAEPLLINCPVSGHPLPSVYWEKDGLPILQNYNIDIMHETLAIVSANTEDSGLYTCIAKNNAGTVTKDFSVNVNVPPIINFKTANLVTAVETSNVTLDCKATGIPQPIITWNKSEEKLFDSNFQPVIAENDSLLLFDISVEDSGTYKCIAKNSAGNDSITIKLNVIVPPKIDKTQVLDNIQVIEGESLTLLCPVTGTPLPSINWYRKNNYTAILISNSRISVLKNGQILTINKIREEESDIYICQAINEAGIEEMNISVEVLVPPKFTNQNHISNLFVIQGDTLIINCSITGNPKPKINWRKDGYPLSAVNFANIHIDNEQIVIKESQILNSGHYNCMAENVAGHISREFQVSVVVPPWLEENAYEKLEVIRSHPAILNCPVGGIPPPIITWMKTNNILRRNGIRTINGGRTLMLSRTELNDGGIYTCIAENTAGEVKKDIDLIILVPPYIKSQQITPIVKTMKGDTINLECEVSGIPIPEVRWMKDDLSIDLIYRYPEYETKSTNLVIANLTESDGGRYTCTAVNKAGSSSRDYSVNVMIPPKLTEEKEQQRFEFTSGTPIQLLCPIYGQPFPTITWTKDGIPVEQTSELTLLEKGRILHIYSSSNKNEGHYACIAENEAGKTEKHYDVDIVVPPHIGEVVDRHNINEGNEFYLYCPVRGSPLPDIVWLHNGHIINSDNNSDIEITENGTLMHIENVEAKHGGQYTCIASNLAGIADQNFFVDVSVPPSISQTDNSTDDVLAIVNHPVTIKCPANGIPPPSIQWFKNGRPIEHYADTNIMLSANRKHLTIKHARMSDTSTFKCIAINRAGKTEKEINLQILAPPRLLYNSNRGDQAPYEEEEHLHALENETISLECEVIAVPEPTILWFKDGNLLASNEEYQMTHENQLLHIDSVQQKHNGHYTCVISNSVGTVEKDFIFDVLVSPSIAGSPKVLLEAQIHRPLTVECEASGNPSPSIMWYKNDYPIDTSNPRISFSLNNKQLHFTHILSEDGGDLTCYAENEVGKTKKQFELDVLEPPSIIPAKSKLDTIEGESSSLDCHAIGNPQPTILWLKDENFLTINGSSVQDNIQIYNEGQVLFISNTTANHHGKYICIASNSVGSSEREFLLNVLVPPKLVNNTDTKTVMVGQPVTFNCPIISNPESHITWMKHGRPIDFSNPFIYVMDNGETLKLLRSRESDNGYFSCIARNYVGEVKGTFPLKVLTPPSIDKSNIITSKNAIVNGIIILECPAVGVPLPSIEWYFDDELILFNNNSRYSKLSDGKILRISSIEPNDAGNFKCVAKNPVGEDEVEFDLEVFIPPTMNKNKSKNIIQEVEGKTVIIDCPLETANPSPAVMWLKDGNPVSLTNQHLITSSSAGFSLTIRRIQPINSGIYKCLASNIAGHSEHDTRLEVIVPPMIINSNGEQRNPKVIKHQPLTLNCKTDGIPHPRVTWLKNNTLINSKDYVFIHDGETLRILRTEEKDSGIYICKAENIGGSKNKTFNVTVLVPPYMNPSPAQTKISSILYHNIHLYCPALGFPKPWISWYKDSRLLTNGSHIQLSSNQTNLYIKNATSQDAGSYVCTAVNEAGSSDKEILLTILIPPKIIAVELLDSQLPVYHQSIRIVCKVEGYPTPFVTWFKNEDLLNSNHAKSYYIQGQGHILEIESLQSSDNGLYICFAENNAGIAEDNFLLDILDPPSIVNESQTIDVNLGSVAEIKCIVSGDPSPQVSWLKNGHPIDNVPDINFRDNNTILRINSTTEDHHARYTCIATNQVGSVEQDFHLNIQIRPSFDTGNEEVSSAVNRPLKLNCPAKGKPLPYITWFKDDQPITATDNIYINGNSLQIHRSSTIHQGIYKCKAINTAGNAEKYFKVMITVPPNIMNKEQTAYISVITNNSVEMSCLVEGIPAPTIMWKKDGQLINTIHSNHQLHIANATIEDTGTYQCIATNIMGNNSKSFSLTVLDPPRIEMPKENLKVILGETVMIDCTVHGFPLPEISWMKNDVKLESTSTYYYINEKGSLHFYSINEDDTANYTCIAVNEAGSANSTVSLTVLIPPSIEDSRSDVHVLIDHPAILDCKVKGFPDPHIIWLKGTKVLQEGVEYEQLESGSLYISKSKPINNGQYMCTAENEAGIAKANRNLHVESPAIIREKFLEEITIIQGKDLELECPTEGYPVPKISWEKDSQSISSTQPRYHLQNSGNLLITMTQSEDGGVYQCIAENGVGKDAKTVNVIVHVPAIIQQDQAIPTIEAPLGGNIVLPCEVSGFPPPDVSWQHNGQPINADFQSGSRPGDLQLNNLKPEDSGQYVCVAVNEAGQDFWEVNVQVLIPPTITVLPQSQNISVGAQFSLNCQATGFPVPTVTWFHHEQKVSEEQQISGGKSSFTKLHAENSDEGIYTCLAQNSVGEKKVQVYVHVRVDGNWAQWSPWSPCSRSCGAGTRLRKRTCDSPAPHNGGRYCLGSSQQTDYCNNNHCPIHGGWSTWSAWGECSASCSGGQRKSFRTCTNPVPSQGGRPCVGASYRTESCHTHSCSDSPDQVLANLIGELNNVDILLSKIEANITKDESGTKLVMTVSNIPENIGHWLKVLVPLEPLYWVKAFEIGQAVNGYSLTKGFFSSDTDIQFPTGEVVRLNHVARGTDRDGRLLIDVVLSGQTPEISRDATVTFFPFTEDYIQTGPGSLYAKSSRSFLVNTHKLPYAWNHTINYDISYGEMPSPVEKLRAANINSRYNSETRELNYSLDSSISLGGDSSQCPEGFQIHPTGVYCSDVDECQEKNRCQHYCENILGSYYCLCPSGYSLTSNQHTCTDIDECLVFNISCGPERTCFNTRGSFQCIDIPCPPNYHRDPITRYCKLECDENDADCPQHMKFSEILAFKMVALPKGVRAYQDLIRLTAYDQEGNHLPHSTFTISDNDTGVPFRIRLENGRGVLYTLRDLDPQEYRIKVQAVSYDHTYQKIQHTTKFMVFISISEHPY